MKLAKQLLAASLALSAALLVSCAQMGLQPAAKPGDVTHVVLVWLKHKGDAAERAKVIETAKGFRDQIPGIISLSIGEPLPSTRPVVDSSFDVGLVMRFESKEALNAYEKNPIHVKAVKEILAPLAAKLVVHDWTEK
ncbi:MAG: Dabb family protein [Verrucomicrobia bacterium]|nr:Dabb family protein [Verrucomicrobiota bacterium]